MTCHLMDLFGCFGASRTDWNVADLTPGIPHLTVHTPLALLAQVHPPLPLAQPRILGSVGMHVFFLCSKHAFSFLRCWSCCYAARLPCASRVLEDSRLGLELHHAHWVLLGRKWTPASWLCLTSSSHFPSLESQSSVHSCTPDSEHRIRSE
ncbi:hypothetical protein KOW79_005125 [Hemibagrus wyckioides]|uniref:Uncharacterized protein n=1 Tax=Hemibagrus wyckioides TaxID=337641 RepID=A0A9D3NZ25_9TELE|nr:hypothetical protein KOW79_005125 [Hemibagrus wyckioides]